MVSYFGLSISGLGSAMKTAVHLSSLPQGALCKDLDSLYGLNLDRLNDDNTLIGSSIFNDIQSNINLDEKSLKSARITILNNMAEWELDEIEHEQKYIEAQQQQNSSERANPK